MPLRHINMVVPGADDPPPRPPFDPQSPKYRCIRGRGPHVRTLAALVGCLELLGASLIVVWITGGYVYYQEHAPIFEETLTWTPIGTFFQRRKIRDVEVPALNAPFVDNVWYSGAHVLEQANVSPLSLLITIIIGPALVCVITIAMLNDLYRTQSMCVMAHLVLQILFEVAYVLAPIIYTGWCWHKGWQIPYRFVAVMAALIVLNSIFISFDHRAYRYVNDKLESTIKIDPTIDVFAVAVARSGMG